MKLVVIGDFHIPGRVNSIPPYFKGVIRNEKPDCILCTGDFTERETFDELKQMAEVRAVRGNVDSFELPLHQKMRIGDLVVFMTHSREVYPRGDEGQLLAIAVREKADILVYGHTHKCNVKKAGNVLLLNPGSATGVSSGYDEPCKPSMIVMSIDGRKISVRQVYEDGDKKESFVL